MEMSLARSSNEMHGMEVPDFLVTSQQDSKTARVTDQTVCVLPAIVNYCRSAFCPWDDLKDLKNTQEQTAPTPRRPASASDRCNKGHPVEPEEKTFQRRWESRRLSLLAVFGSTQRLQSYRQGDTDRRSA